MIIPKRKDSVIPTKLLVGILVLLLTISAKNEEQILALERIKGSLQQTNSFALSNPLPANTDPGSSKAQILNRSTSADKVSSS